MGEMMVKNQSNYMNLLSARQTVDVYPTMVAAAADVQRWGGVIDNSSSSEDELGVDEDDEAMSSASSFAASSSSGSLGSNSSAEDLQDDASSTFDDDLPSPAAPRLSRGPLYELSGLMNELPVKRGLSKHFQGKSQSFTSLSNVQTLEDLAKRENPYKKKNLMMKSCKSYACGLDNSKSFAKSSKMIMKNKNGGSFSNLLGGKRNGFMSCSVSPPILE